MAWDDRFQEAPEYYGGRCSNCDAPLTDENQPADVTIFKKVARGMCGFAWEKEVVSCCQAEARIQAMRNAIAFLQDEIRRHEGDTDMPCPEDALGELCDAFGFTYGVAANA